MNRIILLSVDDAWIKRSGETAGASGSAGAVTLRMTFDSAWDGTSKTVYFTDALGENSVKVLLGLDALVSDNTYDVPVPGEAMTQPGQATVTVVGESEGRVITTQAARFRVLDAAIPPSAGNSQPITPDEAAQLQAQIDALEEIFVTNRQQAQDAAQQAESAKDAVLDAIDNIPPGAVLVINDLTTGGAAVALSAEQGKKLDETKADRQLSNLDTPQAALMNLGAGVRPNIVRNPDFKINQTQFSSTDWKSDYGPDGWKSAGAGHLEYTGGSVTFVNQYLLQFYENGVITAGTYTISALCTGNIQVQLGYWTGDYQNVSSNNYKNGLASVTIQIPSNDDSKLGYIYIKTISDNRSVSFVKLEKGKGQTLAYFDSTETAIMFPQPDMVYSQQLAICQHYQVKLKQNFAVGFADTESTAYFLIPIPVPLRTLPALVYDSLPVLFPSNGVSISAVSVLSNSDCTNSVVLSVSGSGFTPGKIYFIQAFDCLLNSNF